MIREICKENAGEFKWIVKVCLNFPAFSVNDFNFKMSYSRKPNRGGSEYGVSSVLEK